MELRLENITVFVVARIAAAPNTATPINISINIDMRVRSAEERKNAKPRVDKDKIISANKPKELFEAS